MVHIKRLRLFLSIIFVSFPAGYLNAQSGLEIVRIIPHPPEFSVNGIVPDKIAESQNGNFILDSRSGQVAIMENGRIKIGGGSGSQDGSLFDPISINVFYPSIWVTDRAFQRIVKFDKRLSYAGQFSLGDIYPELVTMDPWGMLYFYSERTGLIHSFFDNQLVEAPFMDLNDLSINDTRISAMKFSGDGELGILFPYEKRVVIFNRLGMPVRRHSIKMKNASYLVKYGKTWLAGNNSGVEIPGHGEIFSLPFEESILDVISSSAGISFLTLTSTIICKIRD